MTYALALHGGAGHLNPDTTDQTESHMHQLAGTGAARLKSGDAALDVIVDLVAEMEDCGLYVAGRGASPNHNGDYELDASVMCGDTRRAGAVAALQGFRHPVRIARDIFERTPHVMLAGEGAAQFARSIKAEAVVEAKAYYTPADTHNGNGGDLPTGTVGAVALDVEGRLAAATSTGGTLNKMPGRIGDSPLIGVGCWADTRVAVSCTGQGEYFIRAAVAADISARMRYGGMKIKDACIGALSDMERLGGEGGLIAIDRKGRIMAPFNAPGMRRALVHADGRIEIGSR